VAQVVELTPDKWKPKHCQKNNNISGSGYAFIFINEINLLFSFHIMLFFWYYGYATFKDYVKKQSFFSVARNVSLKLERSP
jgi:hypothetical protein